jgi:hypothetical protein
MLRVKPVFTVVALCGSALAIGVVTTLVWHAISQPSLFPQAWAIAACALISTLALTVSIFGFLVSEERARFTNAFAIAQHWDKEPMLGARVLLRKYLADIPALTRQVSEPEVEAALTHLTNFYWNMAVAMETRWTDAEFLKLRFRPSLETYYRAIYADLEHRHVGKRDLGASPALEAIDKLCRAWGLDSRALLAPEAQ